MYARVLKAGADEKKKKKYKFVVKIPAEKQTGWQESVMDLDKMRASLDAARRPSGKE